MKFFNEYKRQLITLAVIALAVISFFTAGSRINAGFLGVAAGFVITPLQGAVASVTGWVSDSASEIVHRHELADENRELKAQIAELQAENERLSLYEEDNRQLSALLEMEQKYRDHETTGARVIAKDTGVWYDSFLINKGTTDGVDADMPVLSAGGLVGRITKAGATYSTVYSILDSRSSVSAQSLRTGDLGVVVGDRELMEQGLCKMEYIDSDAEIMEGDEIVTSGLSEYYPAGISIGFVREIHNDETGLTRYAVIEPSADMKHLDALVVIQETLETLPKTE